MRRYHHSPSIPFHIARVECLQEPIGASLSGFDSSAAISGPSDHSDASGGLKTSSRVFVGSMWLAGVIIGVGLSVELNGFGPYGLFVQAAGFLLAAVSVIRHPGEGES
jgi:hypothetical protein